MAGNRASRSSISSTPASLIDKGEARQYVPTYRTWAARRFTGLSSSDDGWRITEARVAAGHFSRLPLVRSTGLYHTLKQKIRKKAICGFLELVGAYCDCHSRLTGCATNPHYNRHGAA